MGAQLLPVPNVRAPQQQAIDQRYPDVLVSTRRTKDIFTAALVPTAEAWAVTVSLGTQKTLVMLEPVLLTASTSTSAGERQATPQ